MRASAGQQAARTVLRASVFLSLHGDTSTVCFWVDACAGILF